MTILTEEQRKIKRLEKKVESLQDDIMTLTEFCGKLVLAIAVNNQRIDAIDLDLAEIERIHPVY